MKKYWRSHPDLGGAMLESSKIGTYTDEDGITWDVWHTNGIAMSAWLRMEHPGKRPRFCYNAGGGWNDKITYPPVPHRHYIILDASALPNDNVRKCGDPRHPYFAGVGIGDEDTMEIIVQHCPDFHTCNWDKKRTPNEVYPKNVLSPLWRWLRIRQERGQQIPRSAWEIEREVNFFYFEKQWNAIERMSA